MIMHLEKAIHIRTLLKSWDKEQTTLSESGEGGTFAEAIVLLEKYIAEGLVSLLKKREQE